MILNTTNNRFSQTSFKAILLFCLVLGAFSAFADGQATAEDGPLSVSTTLVAPQLASGTTSGPASLEGSRHGTAVLIDGAYDFLYDSEGDLPLRPYLSGGLGVAGQPSQVGSTVPVARLGGGVAYKLDERWNLSLDYKAGFAGTRDAQMTGRGQQPIDLHSLNLGMKASF